MSPFDLTVLLFLQLALILVACRVVGRLAGRLGQPPVVGEMIAGVLLGPSVLGLVWPTERLFPPESKAILFSLAHLGLALYMFLIGIEFRADLLGARLKSAASVSIAGIVAPFALGAAIGLATHGEPGLFGRGVTPVEAALFVGAALSITAFPMLARILYERGIAGTSLGTLTLAAGSLNDAAAWCVLAVVLASVSDSPSIAAWAIVGGAAYAAVVWLVVRPALAPLGRRVAERGSLGLDTLGGLLVLLMLASWFTEWIGIYSVFGAFVLGTAIPRGKLADDLHRLIHPLTTTLLLPLFFVYSGLNTRIALVGTPALLGLTLAVLLAAIAGKGLACFAAARLHGEPPREAAAIGALMNARGLVELVLLNIGYERGIIEAPLFTILVIMAIVTTLMATPVFDRVYGRAVSGPGRAGP